MEEKYFVVVFYELEAVENEVNDKMEQGYQVHGELTYADGRWYQVMIKE